MGSEKKKNNQACNFVEFTICQDGKDNKVLVNINNVNYISSNIRTPNRTNISFNEDYIIVKEQYDDVVKSILP